MKKYLLLFSFVLIPGLPAWGQIMKKQTGQLIPMSPCKYETTGRAQIRKALDLLGEAGLIDRWIRYDYATTMSGLSGAYTVTKLTIESPHCAAQRVSGDTGDVLKVFALERDLTFEDPVSRMSGRRLEFDYSNRIGGLSFGRFQEMTRGMQRVR
ncbi:MAG: hypothetical protein HXY20_09735 [Acidobacteria bacterium]|nr:hypothetical protein [Acidobacteriota bacterium]